MASDPRTTTAINCEDCGLMPVRSSDRGALLARLPDALWNKSRPARESILSLTGADPVYEDTPFGPIAGDETLQWNISRMFSEERSHFVAALDRAQADQLAVGAVDVSDGVSRSQCHHAAGRDLDRLGESMGIGRPGGFTDCCYWRLVNLMLFQRGSTVWKIVDIAELYTGVRPGASEDLGILTLTWPDPPGIGDSFFDSEGFLNSTAALGGDAPASSVLNAFFDAGWWVPSASQSGFGLHLALERAKPAGIVLRYVNEPAPGLGGCGGAASRRIADTTPSFWG